MRHFAITNAREEPIIIEVLGTSNHRESQYNATIRQTEPITLESKIVFIRDGSVAKHEPRTTLTIKSLIIHHN